MRRIDLLSSGDCGDGDANAEQQRRLRNMQRL